jgi:hypothetical protein
MQTFLPHPDFYQCGMVLDKVRLSKQLVEVQQITNTLVNESKGWSNHPAVRMWADNLPALGDYLSGIYAAWCERGGTPTHQSYHKAIAILDEFGPTRGYPEWLGNVEFHSSHRGRLLHKGDLDVLRKRIRLLKVQPDRFCQVQLNATTKIFLRDLTVAQVERLTDRLDGLGVPTYDNYYTQFGWPEIASDTYFWPVELYTDR